MFMFSVLIVLSQFIIMVNLTLIGGILPLIERKYLSLIQRRVGPKFVGHKGRLQFLADAIKMFLKGQIVPRRTNAFLFLSGPVIFLSLIYLLQINAIWGSHLCVVDVEYHLLLIPIINLYITLTAFFVGFFSKNKYACISSLRIVLIVVCGELLLTSFYLVLIYVNNNLCLAKFIYVEEEYLAAIHYSNLSSLVLLILLIEVSKSPFDLVEAETELVTGFHTEYGSFFFALFYLGEYLHIFFSSCIIVFVTTGLY